MTQEEAAAKLAALLNEIEAAGYKVEPQDMPGDVLILVGDLSVWSPSLEGEPWVVRW